MQSLHNTTSLRSGQLHADLETTIVVPDSTLDHDIDVDVAIVGAGISGAFSAWHLARRGLKVAIVDRRAPATGSTAASTALIQYELDHPLIDLAKTYGYSRAEAVYRVCRDALDWLEAIDDELPQEIGLIQRPTLYAALSAADVVKLKAEELARRKIGLETRFVEKAELVRDFGVAREGAILSQKSFELDPVRLALSLLKGATDRGAQLYRPVEIAGYEPSGEGMTLRTQGGPTIRCRDLVLATGYETPPSLRSYRGEMVSTWACISQPIADLGERWPQRAMVWDHADPYLYARTSGDRVIFGGEDEPFSDAAARDAMTPQKTATLLRRVNELHPGLDIKLDRVWAAVFAQTPDGMPYIDSPRDMPHMHLALGFGGNGVLFSLIAARVLTGKIAGDANLAKPGMFFGIGREALPPELRPAG